MHAMSVLIASYFQGSFGVSTFLGFTLGSVWYCSLVMSQQDETGSLLAVRTP